MREQKRRIAPWIALGTVFGVVAAWGGFGLVGAATSAPASLTTCTNAKNGKTKVTTLCKVGKGFAKTWTDSRYAELLQNRPHWAAGQDLPGITVEGGGGGSKKKAQSAPAPKQAAKPAPAPASVPAPPAAAAPTRPYSLCSSHRLQLAEDTLQRPQIDGVTDFEPVPGRVLDPGIRVATVLRGRH